jgi:WD40 repeat protein
MWVESVSVTPDGRLAVSGCADQTVRVWDLETGRSLFELLGHSGGITSVAVTASTGCRMTGGVCSSGWSGPWSGESYIARTEKLSVPR